MCSSCVVDNWPCNPEILGAKPGLKLELRVLATFGVSLGVCENKTSVHRPLASCSQGVQVTKTKRIATTSKSHEQICDFSEKAAPPAKNKQSCDRLLELLKFELHFSASLHALSKLS